MKLIKIKFLLVVAIYLSLSCMDAVAAGIFDPPITDKSVEYIGLIFGGKIGTLQLGATIETNGFWSGLFQVFNGIILSVAMVILSYVSSVSILHTAHEGEVMGKKWSSIWIPLRSTIGLLSLAPIPGSGYSLVQVGLMWIILNGIGAADKIWNVILDNVSVRISSTVKTQIDHSVTQGLLTKGKNLSIQMLNSLVCLNLVKNNADARATLNAPFTTYFTTPIANGSDSLQGKLNFGANDPTNESRQAICGSLDVTATIDPSDVGSNVSLSTTQRNQLLTLIYQTKRQTLNSIISIIQPIANNITDSGGAQAENVNSILSNYPKGILYNAVASYVTGMSSLNKGQLLVSLGWVPRNNNPRDEIERIRNAGWILAGSSYMTFSRSYTQPLLVTATTSNTISGSLIGQSVNPSSITSASLGPAVSVDLFNNYSNSIAAPNQTENLFVAPPDSGINDYYSLQTSRTIYIIPAILGFALGGPIGLVAILLPFVAFNEAGTAICSALINLQPEDPLTTIAVTGKSLMETAENLWIGFMAGAVGATLLTSVASCINPFGYAAMTAVFVLLPMFIALITSCWVIGATMSLYMPLVPFLIFSVASLGWLISVIEAMVAAPIISLGLILPAQEEIGAIKPAIGMITSIFLRPMLMVIGLAFSSVLFKVGIISLSEGFKVALKFLADAEGLFSSFSWIAVIGLYLGFAITLVNKCYSLIYHLPDKILSWIGISGERTDVSDVRGAKDGMRSGTSKFAEGQTGAMVGSYKHATSGINEATNNLMKAPEDKKSDGNNAGNSNPLGDLANNLGGSNKDSSGGGSGTNPGAAPPTGGAASSTGEAAPPTGGAAPTETASSTGAAASGASTTDPRAGSSAASGAVTPETAPSESGSAPESGGDIPSAKDDAK